MLLTRAFKISTRDDLQFVIRVLPYHNFTWCIPEYFVTILDVCSNLDDWILQEWIDLEQTCDYGSVIFRKRSIFSCRILIVVSFIFVRTL